MDVSCKNFSLIPKPNSICSEMAGQKLEEMIKMKEEVVRKACSSAMAAHKHPEKPFCVKKLGGSSLMAVISFPGSWSVDDWYAKANGSFGETEINRNLFPSLKTIGTDTAAMANQAFLRRFEEILGQLKIEVKNNLKEKRRIVFSGHSSGGAIAVLATIWQLEQLRRSEAKTEQPLCVTFGSPLVGNFIFSHALRRENWSGNFINFVTRYDLIPIIHLSPLSSIDPEFQSILKSLNPESQPSAMEAIVRPQEASDFFTAAMRNASAIATQSACNLIGSTNLLLSTLPSLVKMSPYRPFGTYVFFAGGRKLVVVKNPEASLQMLFFPKQLSSESETMDIAYRSLKDHWVYETYLHQCLAPEKMVVLDKLEELPLSPAGSVQSDPLAIALEELGLSTRGRLNLRAVGSSEQQKKKNLIEINKKKEEIEKKQAWLENNHRPAHTTNDIGYYDRFKLQTDPKDFQANVKRQELAGIWDEIIEMVVRYELPDEFEGVEEWVRLGTRFRRLVEPLDIANYYGNLKNEDTGPYMRSGRPKRYKFTQKWLEHATKTEGSSRESTFWAEVEELRIKTRGRGELDETLGNDLIEEILRFGERLKKWNENKEIGNDVFLKGSTFVVWWNSLPKSYTQGSSITAIISG